MFTPQSGEAAFAQQASVIAMTRTLIFIVRSRGFSKTSEKPDLVLIVVIAQRSRAISSDRIEKKKKQKITTRNTSDHRWLAPKPSSLVLSLLPAIVDDDDNDDDNVGATQPCPSPR